MATRNRHYFIYDPSDILADSIAFEILGYDDHFRECPIPLLYLSRDLGEAACMLEEAAVYQEEAYKVKDMERISDYYFQVQRTRLVSLEPIDAQRKWATFMKIVEGYNLGEVGCCSRLAAYLDENGLRLLETVQSEKVGRDRDKLRLPGNEEFIADLVNRYNQLVL
jgi:hypothetical protein